MSDGESDLAQYRPVSVAAVIALLMGLLAPLALATPLLWAIPAAAAALALWARRQIARSPARPLGRSLTLAALGSALLFGTAAPARLAVRDAILRQRAEAFATAWLEQVRAGRLDEAHQLALPSYRRLPPSADVERYYAVTEEARQERDAFFARQPLPALVHGGGRTEVVFQRVEQHLSVGGDAYLALGYRLHPAGVEEATRLRVVVQRQIDRERGRGVWRVEQVDDAAARGGIAVLE